MIFQPNDSNSSDDQGMVLDDTQIDETNIRNIIHSSLNNITKTSVSQPKESEGILKRKHSTPVPEESIKKKFKISKDEQEPSITESTFKIVPIQHILNKNINEKSPERSVVNNNPILLKKLSQQSEIRKPGIDYPVPFQCVEIKSEPESEEEIQESENLEAKREYMTALNILERTDEVVPSKKNEIRTRSKMEEIGKGRPMDNLSRVSIC